MNNELTQSEGIGKELVLRNLIFENQLANPSSNTVQATHTKTEAIVLEEEEYMKNLEAIIKRDYFPDLAKIEAYKEYRARKNAGEENVRIPTILIKRTPVGPSNSVQEKIESNTEEPSDNKINIKNMSLDEYLHKYTSEDNKSFEKLFAKQKEDEEKKYAWMQREADAATPKPQNPLIQINFQHQIVHRSYISNS